MRVPRLLHYSDIENVFDDPERAGRLAGLLTSRSGPDSIVVGTGDTVAPGVVSMVASGRQAVDFYAATNTVLETFGNHEFDFGPDELRDIVAEAPVKWVSANILDETGSPFGREAGVEDWAIHEVDRETVGFLGVTDPATDSLNPMAEPIDFTDPIDAAADALDSLRAEGVDHVVVLSHLGAGDDDLASTLDVDVVLGGHVHSPRREFVNDTLLVRPGVNGERIVEVHLPSDTGDTRPTATFHEPTDAPVNEELRRGLTQRLAESGLDEVVAVVDEPIERTGDVVHSGECRIGNFVADAFRWAVDADVGLSNSGGLRSGEPLSGDVTKADMISLLPFEEPVVCVELTGTELRAVLREMAAPDVDFGESGWWHGHVSGASIVWNDADETLTEATVGGDPIDPDAFYTVGTSEYLLHSKHEFPTLTQRHRIGEDGIQHEVLCSYAQTHGIESPIEGRVTILEEPAEPRTSLEPGTDCAPVEDPADAE